MSEPTAWAAVIADDLAMPDDRPREELIAELTVMLADPDPAIRDDLAYPIFATWIVRGYVDGSIRDIGDTVAAMFEHDEIQARTFAALILAAVVRRDADTGEVPRVAMLGWRDRFARWWRTETDLRGFDDHLGWLHAIAHGADVVRAFARSPQLDQDDLDGLLRLTADRLLAPTDYRFSQFEDARLAYAATSVLARPELTEPIAWLDSVHAAIDAGEPGRTPIWAANTVETLTTLYVQVTRGIRWFDAATGEPLPVTRPPAATGIAQRIADILRLSAYWLG